MNQTDTHPEPAATPLVSVGVPVYNAARWLPATLNSILRQTLTDFELILCDNASTDESFDICRSFAERDPRVRCYRNDRNIGANRNYRLALAYAKGRYFKWWSSSDLCSPTFLADCVAALQVNPDLALVSGRTVLFADTPEDGQPYGADFELLSDDASERYARLFAIMKLNNALNGVMRTADIKSVAPLGTFKCADSVMMAELALLGKFKLLDQPRFYRRMTVETATKLKNELAINQHMEPSTQQPLLWQSWLLHVALLRAAVRSAPAGGTWFRAVGRALRQAAWARGLLARDVWQAVRRLV
jgi:glycosyltransferase involved in cell wall biosynthesis